MSKLVLLLPAASAAAEVEDVGRWEVGGWREFVAWGYSFFLRFLELYDFVAHDFTKFVRVILIFSLDEV